MTLPTVAALCAALPDALAPAEGFVAPTLGISAVHVSELIDPTEYLTGGELLLTTGLSLPDSAMGCDRYVSRLRAVGISALGVGLGPTLSAIPEPLAAACATHDLCLLSVPPAAAFLTITKAYWAARSLSTQRELTDAISAHRSLVNAMVTTDPVGQTLTALSRAIGAWVARLDSVGVVQDVFPSGRVNDAVAVAEQITALRVAAGAHSVTTFPHRDEIVSVYPLQLEDRVAGYLAIGSRAPLGATPRRLVLTAGALLSLDSVQRKRADAAVQAQAQAVTSLLDMGFVEPARRLASRAGLPALDQTVRLLVIRSDRAADITEAVTSWSPLALTGPFEGDTTWFVLPASGHADIATLDTRLRAIDNDVVGVLSDAVELTRVRDVRVGLFVRARSLAPGTVLAPEQISTDLDLLRQGIDRVFAYKRAHLAPTLVAYLRHRGHWDAAARDLAVHRNTVRHRMGLIRELLDADPDDPDIAAEMWLHLRRNGLA